MLCIHLFQPKQIVQCPQQQRSLFKRSCDNSSLLNHDSYACTDSYDSEIECCKHLGSQPNNVPIIWKPCKLWCFPTLLSQMFAVSFLSQIRLIIVMGLLINDLQGRGRFDFMESLYSWWSTGSKMQERRLNNETGQCCSLGHRGLNPIQHKQYQCHHFFLLWLVVMVALPWAMASIVPGLSCLCIEWRPPHSHTHHSFLLVLMSLFGLSTLPSATTRSDS